MRKTLTHAAAASAMALLAASLVAIAATPAAASAARVPPASVQGDCDSDSVPVVVASDVAAQSDIYSAVTLAGVLGDACIVLAGPRNEAVPSDQQSRLDAAASGGYVIGGRAAVPDGKVAGRTVARLGGADRWATALLVGDEAAELGSTPTATVPSGTQFTPTPGSPSGTAATRVRVPPASVQGDCDSGTTPVVVTSDLAAQSDIYSAVTLAGVLGDACIVLAGPRDEAIADDQQERLDSAADGGYVVGGQAAVPDAKVAGRTMARLGGADRWATALLVGEEAAEPGSAPTTTFADVGEPEPQFEFPPMPSWLVPLAADYPYTQQVGAARVHSDISREFSRQHAVMLDKTFRYFDGLYARNRGPLVEAFYTRDETIFEKVVPHCPTVFVPGARNLTACYGDIARWFIIPYQVPDFGTLLHEIGHDFAFATFPHFYTEASWYVEGTAMYFESGVFDSSGDLIVSEPLQYCTQLYASAAAQGELIPLRRLMSMTKAEFLADNENTYSQSCMLIRYLADGHPGVLDELIERLNSGAVVSNAQLVTALLHLVGQDTEQLEASIRAWMLP